MSRTAFAARRRQARSSREFRLLLFSALLFCLVLAWCHSTYEHHFDNSQHPSSRARPESEAPSARIRPRPPPHQQAARMRVDLDGRTMAQEVIASPDDATGATGTGMATATTMPLRLVTFNIRFATKPDERAGGERPWSVRCPRLGAQLRFVTAGHESPFICLQEVLHAQVGDVQAQLGSSWAHIGRGRGDNETDGEFSPVFYRADVWRCVRNETRWLSPTPEKPSRGWDAVLNRIVTMGEFSHRTKGTRVVVMSTHFDHMGVKARTNSAKLLIKFAKEWTRSGHVRPSVVLVGGDFNSSPHEEAYQVMTERGSGMLDVADLVPEERRYGNHLTYTSFGEPNETPSRIDFLFIQDPHTARVDTFGVLANSFDDQIRVSDHRAVVADFTVKT
ncbi:endonuclease/Exonuclease/phosphatase family protein [Purpureocillium lavendulum]|uniref:Endonuclease/Exonuclease/phosphatase family protein n=1 Tax=Purpureocillium lavendulum TaxID=1247861 RepID=A0AB34FTW6_9HYPO|nr:endonuclease/Exonuclease/phosphatase family protein [Purpureocillium lavendulum]